MRDWLHLVVFVVFSVSAAVQLFYYLYFYLSVNRKTEKGNSLPVPVSVIICARNEAEHLKEFLPLVLKQDYPDFEVIVVNDCSEDDTYNILGKYLQEFPNLRVCTINKDPKFTHNKKLAQLIGIKAAKNDILLFTDADCKPVSDKWMASMASRFNDGISYVLGYGGYMKQKGLLNTYIRYDTAVIAMQYLGMALRSIPYMGVGRNLAYRRKEFFENNGFGVYSNLASGDDDLFVNNNAKPSNTTVEFNPEAHTRSVPPSSLNEWISQKKRHFTTAPFYKPFHKFILFLEPATRVLFFLTFILLIASWYLWIPVLAIFTGRLVVQVVVMNLVFRKLQEAGLLSYSLFFDIFSPFINSMLFISRSKGSRKSQWR